MNKSAAVSATLTLSLIFSPVVTYAETLPGQTTTLIQSTQPVTQTPTPQSTTQSGTTQTTSTSFLQSSSTLSETTTDSRILGVEEGGTVSGVVEIRPNQEQLPGIRKVAYYLNGSQSGRVYQSPFMWGGISGNGTAGFDTRNIADGKYKLDMVYTDSTGDHPLSVNFTVNNTSSPTPTPSPSPTSSPLPPGDANASVWGATYGQTVSGTVYIRPNPDKLLPGTTQVTWTLKGQSPVTVTQQPFIFGGANGNGTTGFDTRTLQDGVYDLNFFAPGPQGGSVSSGIRIVVENQQDPKPSTSRISPSGRTAGGLQFPSGTSFVDVEHSGTLSFLANQNALYIVNASTASQPQLLSAVDFRYNPPIVDIAVTPDGKGVFVLEKGPVNSSGFPEGRLWHVDVSNPSAPVRKIVAGGPSSTGDPKGLRIANNQLYVLLNEEHAALACRLDGSGCQIPEDYYSFRDLMVINGTTNYSARRGSSTLRTTPAPMDYADTTTAAPVGYLSGKDNYLFVSLKNGTTAVYNTAQANAEGVLPAVKTFDPQGNDPVFSLVEGNRLAILDSTGLIEVFDVTNPLNPVKVDSLTFSGARSLAYKNGILYAVTSNQYRIATAASSTPEPTPSPSPSPSPTPTTDSRILGVQEGQTVSGIVEIRPNQQQLPGIRKVSYYLNGTQSGRVYQSPFMWGGLSGNGTTGFDTRTLANGTYTLSMVYTDATGDHPLTVRFTVSN
jgi:hypothetical protein